jgi:hypothetical protein
MGLRKHTPVCVDVSNNIPKLNDHELENPAGGKHSIEGVGKEKNTNETLHP